MGQCSCFTFCPELIMIIDSPKGEDLRRGYVKPASEARYRAHQSDKMIAYLSRMIIVSDREGEGHWGQRLMRYW